MTKGQIVGGAFGKILVREKAGKQLEIGELLIAEHAQEKLLLQVYDILYGSQLSRQNLELISGMQLEEDTNLEFMDPEMQHYRLAFLKNVAHIKDNKAYLSKKLPPFFSEVRAVTKEDVTFLAQPKKPLFFGELRSGSVTVGVPVALEGDQVLSHHILIAATTGRGKSNLAKNVLKTALSSDYCGFLVLDPHDEYYGRTYMGLKDVDPNNLEYYTPANAPPGSRTLRINITKLRPWHFNGVVHWTDPQQQALFAYFKTYKGQWIQALLEEKTLEVSFVEGTLHVVRRKLLALLNLSMRQGEILTNGIFSLDSGMTTVDDIAAALEQSKVVIIDTSHFAGNVELLIGSMITTELFHRYKRYKEQGRLDAMPVISIVLEEAPRVLGKDVLERGSNIFSTIAREGRKFKIGLTAITQLPSLIPRQILANMNTKIVLGLEMKAERMAIIEAASQDLSNDEQTIASLDTGEALITSNFTKFAIPVKIPLFRVEKTISSTKPQFLGL